VLARIENFKGAIADYTKAIEINPNYGEAYYNRGLSRLALGQKNKSTLEDFQKAAKIYQEQGKTEYYQDALERIKELQQSNPGPVS
jgi:tetratricopeptide (TPR) repeat protein